MPRGQSVKKLNCRQSSSLLESVGRRRCISLGCHPRRRFPSSTRALKKRRASSTRVNKNSSASSTHATKKRRTSSPARLKLSSTRNVRRRRSLNSHTRSTQNRSDNSSAEVVERSTEEEKRDAEEPLPPPPSPCKDDFEKYDMFVGSPFLRLLQPNTPEQQNSFDKYVG